MTHNKKAKSTNANSDTAHSKSTPQKRIAMDDWESLSHITHDTFFQVVFSIPEIAVAFLKNILLPELFDQIDFDKLDIQDSILGESDYFQKSAADIVYAIPFKNRAEILRVYVILEHKSYSDSLTIFQLTRYCVHIMEREIKEAKQSRQKMSQFRFSPILPVIIHHGRSPFKAATELSQLESTLTGMEEHSLKLKAFLFDLNCINVNDLPYGTNVPEFISVLKMMQAIFSRKGAVLASEAFKALRPYSENIKYKNLIRTMLMYMTQCSKHINEQEYNQLVSDDKIINQGEKDMTSLAQQWIAEGKEQGIEQGAICTLRDVILQILKTRFGNVSESVEQNINRKNDIIALKSLIQSATIAKTLDEFIKEL